MEAKRAPESLKEMRMELESLRVAQMNLLAKAQSSLASPMNILTDVLESDPVLRTAAANVEAVLKENPADDEQIKPLYDALVERANPVAAGDTLTRKQASKLASATALRNLLIKAVVYAGMRTEYLQQQVAARLRKNSKEVASPSSGTLKPAEVLEVLGILPPSKKNRVLKQKELPQRRMTRSQRCDLFKI
ncbi:uncharacterized protein LOC108161454 [Drosophila miranda]|uniref:uncharacterized protein LOC108161454 n=1 Tax=Drosophila miranda TaxID=7229 RepID=UPI0007E70D35|nr:uncharacterized protein LOC108161454 [Drosophila miranda]